ncbi:MAG: hypothetical protein PHN19_00100 [Patescibacteria group bacterium]|nr:hypothetical protein [Patescibacteria group bacterium]
MTKYLTINKSLNSKNRNKTIKNKLSAGPVTLAIVTVVLFCALGLLFLAQVFQSQTKSYEVLELKQKAEELKQDNKDLEIKSAELRSMDHIKQSAKQLNLVDTKNIVYINKIGNSVVVMNR